MLRNIVIRVMNQAVGSVFELILRAGFQFAKFKMAIFLKPVGNLAQTSQIEVSSPSMISLVPWKPK